MSQDSNATAKPAILVVEDDDPVRESLAALFADDYIVVQAASGGQAIEVSRSRHDIATVILDIRMAPMDGISCCRHLRETLPMTPIIFHTGVPGEYKEAEIDRSQRPFGYVVKGDSLPSLVRQVRNGVEHFLLLSDNRRLERLAERELGLIGRSEVMRAAFRKIVKVAPTSQAVLLLGETGSGKELAARALHALSTRAEREIAILNCNHKDPTWIEAELFGCHKGTFTGVGDRIGLVEFANGSTLFLDEIGDLDITSQAKILRVIETGEYQKIGRPEERRSDFRLICATNKDLAELVRKGEFRADLLYRLRAVTIRLPALRERKEDIPALAQHFLWRATVKKGLPPKELDSHALDVLIDYHWPGNVRQLKQTIEAACTLSGSSLIMVEDIRDVLEADGLSTTGGNGGFREELHGFERELITKALTRTGGNVAAAARVLKIDNAFLHRKLKEHGLEPESFRLVASEPESPESVSDTP